MPRDSELWGLDGLFRLESGLDQESGLETTSLRFLHFCKRDGGLPRSPKSGVETACFVQNLELLKNLG